MALSNSQLQALSLISVSPATVTFPSLVLYFQHWCHYCTDFLRDDYLTLAQHYATTLTGNDKTDVKIVAIDCNVHKSAMDELNANARSTSVPHLVFHKSLTSQIPFTNDVRTTKTVTAFIRENNKGAKKLGGGGGGDGDTTIRFYASTREQPRIKEHLQAALYGIGSLSRDEFGRTYKRMFEPSNASVYFIGIRRLPVPPPTRSVTDATTAPPSAPDTTAGTEIRSEIETPDEKHYELFILLIPEKQVFRLRPDARPAFGAIRGHRMSKLDAWMYVNVDPVRIVWEQLRKGFAPAKKTNIVARLLRENFGYALRV